MRTNGMDLVGLLGPRLTAAPYVVVAHGSEITGYARLPGSRPLAQKVMRGAAAVVAAGSYPARASADAGEPGCPPAHPQRGHQLVTELAIC